MNYNFIKTLKDNNDIAYSNSKNIFKIITNYYIEIFTILKLSTKKLKNKY